MSKGITKFRSNLLRKSVTGLIVLGVFLGPAVFYVHAPETGQQIIDSAEIPKRQVFGAFAMLGAWCDALIEFLRKSYIATDFQPQWVNGAWSASHAWLHISANLIICMTSLLIPVVLAHFVRRRHAIPYAGVFWLFGALIFSIGIAALLDASMFWWPAYRLTSLAKSVVAILSLITIAVLIPIVPKALAMRSPTELQREIAQRRRTEMELRRVHAQLESVIELRTAELAAKTDEMEQFLNTVTHDLKNPIVTCLGLTGILREDLKSGRLEDTNDTITRIDRSVNRMRQLVDDLLNLGRIGRIRFELAEVNLSNTIRSIGDELRPKLKEAGAILEIEDTLPTVCADERWLSEVFENLLTNAIKYGCDNPQPRITVGAVSGENEIQVFVRDNGRGIDPAHHAQVFEPFRRLRSDKEGNGMGLAIVVRIIKMHGGRVWIDSQLGQGATFWVVLPVSSANATPTKRLAA